MLYVEEYSKYKADRIFLMIAIVALIKLLKWKQESKLLQKELWGNWRCYKSSPLFTNPNSVILSDS